MKPNKLFACILLVALVLACAGSSLAQAPPQQPGQSVPMSKAERLNRVPVSSEILRVKLPKPFETSLENGLTVMIYEDHRLPTVFVQLQISGAGALYEPPELAGLASATAQMLREGTKTRTSKQIAEQIDQLGATMGAGAGFGSSASSLNASGLSDNFDQWFSLALDLLLNPTFPAEELTKLKDRQKQTIRQQRASPAFLANERISRALYGSHPAAIVAANEKSIDALTPELLTKWHAEHYAPQNAILGIAGDVDAKTLLPKLKQWLASWKKNDYKEMLPPEPAPSTARKIYVVDRPGSVQTDMVMGNLTFDRRHPDYIALQVMHEIYGNGPASRLFLNLRENKGFTYTVGGITQSLKYPGFYLSNSSLRTEVTDGAMSEFLVEMKRIREEKVPSAELEEKKRAVVARFALQLESPMAPISNAILRRIYGFPDDYWDTYPAKVMAITADDVQRVAQKYLNPDTMIVVAVGDGSKIKSVMEKYGPVEVYNAEGQPVAAKPAASGNN
jgi:zinc protease